MTSVFDVPIHPLREQYLILESELGLGYIRFINEPIRFNNLSFQDEEHDFFESFETPPETENSFESRVVLMNNEVRNDARKKKSVLLRSCNHT